MTSTFGRPAMKLLFCTALLLVTVATVSGAIIGPTTSFTRDIGPQATPEDITIFGKCVSIFHIDVRGPGYGQDFEINASISSKREIRNVRVTFEQGEEGTASFVQVLLFTTATFSGSAKLPAVTVGTTNCPARIRFWGEEFAGSRQIRQYDSRIPIADLLTTKPNSEGRVTR